jgi:hypothetical protein
MSFLKIQVNSYIKRKGVYMKLIEREIKFNNHEKFLMKIYDGQNNEIDLLLLDFVNIKLKGKKVGETKTDEFDIDKTGVLYTDDDSENWILFEFTVNDFDNLVVGSYVCEIIIEQTGNVFKNLVEKTPNTANHRFILKIVDTYVEKNI